MNNSLKSLLIGVSVILSVGSITVLGLTIPTNQPATHEAYLSELYLGQYGAEQRIYVQEENLVIDGGLMIGNIDTMTASSSAKNIFVGGGREHDIRGNYAAVGAGQLNKVNGDFSFIGGGRGNTGTGENFFVGGGEWNEVIGNLSTIIGGRQNKILGDSNIIAGGQLNTVSKNNSFAAGQGNQISHSGVFAWSDADDDYRDYFKSSGDNTFIVRSLNGMAINTASVPTGVNVNINGKLFLHPGGNSHCDTTNAGELKYDNGCFKFCNGATWETINENFGGDPGRCEKTPKCKTAEGIEIEVGAAVTLYSTNNDANCEARKKVVKCKAIGTDINFDDINYKYIDCTKRG